MSNAPFPINPQMSALAIAYRNPELIADAVLPYDTVATQEFKYFKWKLEEGYTIPDTRVGRRSQPNEVEFSATETTASTEDFGLDDPVPQGDIDNAKAGGTPDPLNRAVEGTTDLILLDREVRTAAVVFALATYAATQRVTLAGNDQWNVYAHADSDPIADIKLGLETPILRPNVMVIGQAAWSKLNSHPVIMKAVNGTNGDTGIARKAQIAELFELEEILVGSGYVNTAKKGQAATMARVWGKHCALIRRDKLAGIRNGSRPTFGVTARWGNRIAGSMPDSKIGLRGGQRVRVGESVKELITANDLGYFIQNAVG